MEGRGIGLMQNHAFLQIWTKHPPEKVLMWFHIKKSTPGAKMMFIPFC
mgnify:CR=1 FL=1